MAYVTFADFRTATLAEHCYGLALTTTEAPDAALTAAIATYSQRMDNLTNDHYETETLTYDLDVDSTTDRLYLPKRCRSISTLQTRDYAGTLTNEATTVYRLTSSLDAAGALREPIGGLDHLDIIPGGSGLSTGYMTWPVGPQTVRVTGQFSWATTPSEIKWAVARLCYARFKESRADLDRAETLTNAGVTLRFLESDAEHPTGLREVDEIVADYKRDSFIGVG